MQLKWMGGYHTKYGVNINAKTALLLSGNRSIYDRRDELLAPSL